jgi:hypothetical protein
MYPIAPIFEVIPQRTEVRQELVYCINITCHFQNGREKLSTVGAGRKKKLAIVQASRNMLKQLFPNKTNLKDSQSGWGQTASDQKKTPWTCHFCNVSMNGRRPLLSHLTGCPHIQRMSELDLNAEEQNNILQSAAEEAYKKRKRNSERLP